MLERPTRATRAQLTTSADEFANLARPTIAAAAGGQMAMSLIAVKVDGGGVAANASGDVGNTAALREQVVELVRRNLRGGDVVAHTSPEEFLVLLQGAPEQQGSHVARRLCAAIRNHAFAGSGGEGRRLGVTASMGVASAPQHGGSVDDLVSAAREACTTVGSSGGDGSVVAAAKPGDRVGRTFDIGRFVGRSEEIASLRRWLDEAIAGSPRAVAVIGEAGSGRSALLRQLEPEVRLRGGSMVIARAKMGSVRTPYGIWSQVLQAL
ncbi:MAG TPA: AAA family ATPase, partial [Gemmatimonadales bacterium]|nr:AAA family ATPase [Gemmatimonadales bacterium]